MDVGWSVGQMSWDGKDGKLTNDTFLCCLLMGC
jgi:hypothetical protein